MLLSSRKGGWAVASVAVLLGCSSTPSTPRSSPDSGSREAASAEDASRDADAGQGCIDADACTTGPGCEGGADTCSDGCTAGTCGPQPLKIDPDNPHYFLGLDGKPVLLVGYTSDGMMGMQDYRYYIDQLAAHGSNLVYIMGNYGNDPSSATMFKRAAGSGSTLYGYGDKFDLDQFDSSYFSHMSDICAYALSRGLYVSVHIWSSFYLRASGGSAPEWGYNGGIFTPENTVTDTAAYGFPHVTKTSSVDTHDVFTASLTDTSTANGKTLLERQQDMFDKTVGATKDYPNVYYEFGTEFTTSNTTWAKYWVDRLHSEAPGKLIVVCIPEPGRPTSGPYSFYTGDTSFFDGVLFHPFPPDQGIGTDTLAQLLYQTGKIGWYDTDARDRSDWVTSQTVLRNVAWPQVVSGVNFREYVGSALVNDGASNVAIANPGDLSTLGLLTGFFAQRDIPFASMKPHDDLATNGVDVLAGSGVYVAYSQGTDFSLALDVGSYAGQWYDPRTGQATSIPSFSSDGGPTSFTLPTSEDWVLYLHQQ